MEPSHLLAFLALGSLHFSCDRPGDTPQLGETDERPSVPETLRQGPVTVEIVTDPDAAHSIVEVQPKKPLPLFYSEGDTFQGMWNYDRRNFNLRMRVTHIDPDKREIKVLMHSDDLDAPEKEMTGRIHPDGRQVTLKGISGTGADSAIASDVSGYHVIDLLKKSSTQGLTLNDCNSRQLRGETDDGTNVYFWTKLKENKTAAR